ncbi:MAG: hypothetical protein ACI9XB_002661 [Gammaproteobacteria bacterium]
MRPGVNVGSTPPASFGEFDALLRKILKPEFS